MKIATCAVVGAAFSLAGCATLLTGNSQSMDVVTTPGATCELSNLEGDWTVVTPAAANVERGHDALLVKCTKPGYQLAWTTVPSHLELWTFANILNFDVGTGVDTYTGAIDAYPHTVELPMKSAAMVSPQAPQSASPPPVATPPK